MQSQFNRFLMEIRWYHFCKNSFIIAFDNAKRINNFHSAQTRFRRPL